MDVITILDIIASHIEDNDIDLFKLVLLENPDVENQHLEELYFRSTNRQKVRQCITAELLPIWHRFM